MGPRYAQWLNPAAFAIPASGTWGNAGRVDRHRSGLLQVDCFAAEEDPHLRGQGDRLPRRDMFNIVNHVQPANPGTTFTSPASFGLINSGLNRTIGTGTSRQVQLSMRLTF